MEMLTVSVAGESAAALGEFGKRVGVAPEGVLAVMVGLAENRRRDRHNAGEMAAVLVQCQDALEEQYTEEQRTALSERIDACLERFAAMRIA